MLLRKPRSRREILNDCFADLLNLYRVLQDQAAGAELIRLVSLTPFSRAEYDLAHELADCPIERARRLLIRSWQGYAAESIFIGNPKSGFKGDTKRQRVAESVCWAHFPAALASIRDRLHGVILEERPALDIISYYLHGGPETLLYLDPPYLLSTRGRPRARYAHEMTADDHRRLLKLVLGASCSVVISGYAHDLYDSLLAGWQRVTHAALADGGADRTEVLWINPTAAAQLENPAP